MSFNFKKLLTSIFFLSLPVFLFILLVSRVYAQDSYIIVHALNPEGVEIASIQGMSDNYVAIYDGDTFIRYGACDAETYNKSIAISPGSHTIKAKFNGMTKEQNITLNSGETKVVTFVFERTEFDILSKSTGVPRL